jgi:hypothetical protein
MTRWLVIGVDCATGKRRLVVASATRQTALAHKTDLQEQKPLRFAGA